MEDTKAPWHQSIWAIAVIMGFGSLVMKVVGIWTDGRVSERFSETSVTLLVVAVALIILGLLVFWASKTDSAVDEPVAMDELEDLDYEDDESDWR